MGSFLNALNKIKEETGFVIPNISVVEVIDADKFCIAGYKPYENKFYISSKYFNSKDAILDALGEWASNNITPKRATSIRYLAEHEVAHMRIPDELLLTDEAKRIFKRAVKKGVCEYDQTIFEFYADCLALRRIGAKTDNAAINYLIKEGVSV